MKFGKSARYQNLGSAINVFRWNFNNLIDSHGALGRYVARNRKNLSHPDRS